MGELSVSQSQFLAERPTDVEGTTGIYVDEVNQSIEFYGGLRPSYNEKVGIDYLRDDDGQKHVFPIQLLLGLILIIWRVRSLTAPLS